jgi:hydroxypyruvate isomerase
MPKFAANLSSLFTELTFPERFAAAAKHGFAGVEYLFPYDYPKEELSELLKRHSLQQVMFNLPSGRWEEGARGLACDPQRIPEFKDGLELAIEYAIAFDCKRLNVLPGVMPRESCPLTLHETLVGNLRHAASRLAQLNIKLLIEPINVYDNPNFFLHRSSHALAIMSEVNHPNLFLLYDVYHMQITEGNLASTIAEDIASVGHVQIADVPGRNEPGTGEINFNYLFRHLDTIGYDGWIGCQYNPLLSTDAGLEWIAPHQLQSSPA